MMAVETDITPEVQEDVVSSEKKEISWQLSFLLGAIIGAVAFIGIFGFKVLNFSYDDFLLDFASDLAQHYTGWRMYRESGWHFPIGLCDTSMYPYLTSVVYTDSIPLFAVFFKLLSPVLPDTFQYFGLFGILCFMLQGGVTKILLRKYIKSEWVRNIGAFLFVLNIAFIQRMFYHTALSAHFLILLAMCLFVYRKDITDFKKRVILWSGLGVISITIHFYIYGIISMMLAGYALLELLDTLPSVKEAIKRFIILFVSYLVSTVFVFYIFGGFYGTVEPAASGLGIYSANINSLINPQGYSKIIGNLPFFDGQEEGLCYLGLSFLCLFIPAIIEFFREIKDIWKNNRKFFIVTILLSVLFFIIALSPIITIGKVHLLALDFLPNFILVGWSIFKACGRFMWPVMYLIMMIGLVYSQNILKKSFIFVLVVLTIVQVYEYSYDFYLEHNIFNTRQRYVYPADELRNYDLSKYKHIQYMENYIWDDYYFTDGVYYKFVGYSRLAMDEGMTVSNFHFARDYSTIVQNQIDKSYDELKSGKPDMETIYVFDKTYNSIDSLDIEYGNIIKVDTGAEIVILPVE